MSDTQTTIIKPKHPFYLINFKELWRYRELFMIFAWRDLKVRYKQTAIGVAWVLFQPLISMVVFTVFFGNLADIPSQGLPYPVFVLIGLIYWTFFSSSMSHAANSFIENISLINKVYFPREILPMSSIIVGLVDFAVSFLLFVIISIAFAVPWNLAFVFTVMLGLVISLITATGLGLFLASINVKYRDVRYILPFFMQFMIFVTPVIYPLDIVRPLFQTLLQLNPLAGVINSLRAALAMGTIVYPMQLLLSVLTAVVFLMIGAFYFRKTEAFFADMI